MRPEVNIGKILAVCAALVAGLAVATSIWLNPPSENRARAMDMQRVRQLDRIKGAIDYHYQLRQKLPANLEVLEKDRGSFTAQNRLDPGTGQPFEYEIVGDRDYRLCATFERSIEGDSTVYTNRRHQAGRNCFDHKVIVPNT